MSAELSTTTEIKTPAVGETVDLDAMSAQERFDYLNQMNGGYYAEQGLTADTLDDYLSALEAEQDSTSPELTAEAQEIRAQVYELAADGKNADKIRVMQLVLEVINLIRRGGIKLAAGMALLVVLAGCGPTSEATPSPDPEVSASATPEAPEVSPEEITSQFEIPSGLDDQALAEAYIQRINAWWNYGATAGISKDEKLTQLGLGPFALDIADQNSDPIAEGFLTSTNEAEKEANTSINANTIELFIQSELKGEAPYEHTLSLVSLDAVGSPAEGVRVLRITVKESSNRPADSFNADPPYSVELRFVVDGDTEKLESWSKI